MRFLSLGIRKTCDFKATGSQHWGEKVGDTDAYNVEMRKEQKENFNKWRLGPVIFYIFLTEVIRLLCIYHLGQNFENHAGLLGF